ncbi:MAG: ArdC-like ssDNA-binding domain-containing protein [Xanthobacteraceae bacterium]
MRRDLYAEVSERIVAELERGAAPWVKPWSTTAGANTPCNAITNRPYSGCNVVLLWMAANAGYRTPRYLTFKQALDLGGNVRKGEHGTKVYFVKQLQVANRDGEEGETRIVPMMREYTVFNVDQCENLPDSIKAGKPMRVRNPDTRDALADDFLRSTGADIREGHGEAYFVPSQDFISMPAFEAFKGADHFYNVAFHELTHWTGPKSRLDRDLKHRFGERAYAAEELVAELGAAFLSAEFGFDGDVQRVYLIGAESPRARGRRLRTDTGADPLWHRLGGGWPTSNFESGSGRTIDHARPRRWCGRRRGRAPGGSASQRPEGSAE